MEFPDTLREVRDMREEYYRSAEFAEVVENIRGILQGVRGRIIDFDLEGVLVSRNMRDLLPSNYATRRFDAVKASEYSCLRTPFANEIMAVLADKNQVGVWTGIFRILAEEYLIEGGYGQEKGLIAAVGVEVPGKVFSRDDYLGVLIREGYLEVIHYTQVSIDHQRSVRHTEGFKGSDQYHRNRLTLGYIKVPSLRGVDLLIDDYADRHRKGCVANGLAGDAEKIMQFGPYVLKTKEDFMNYRDPSMIVDLAERIAEFFSR